MNMIVLFIAVFVLIASHALAAQPDRAAAWNPDGRTINAEVIVPASREAVWRAWTTNEGAREFFSTHVNIALRPGGAYEILFAPTSPEGERGSEGCRVLSFIENEMLSFTWNAPPNFPDMRWRRTFVVVRFDDVAPEAEAAPRSGTADASGNAGVPKDAGGNAPPRTRVRLTHGGWDAVKASPEAEAVFNYFSRAWPAVLGNLKRRFEVGPLFADAIAASPEIDAAPAMSHFVYFIRPVREALLTEGPTDAEREPLVGHVAYIKALLGRGRLVYAGPGLDPSTTPRGATGVALDIPIPGIVVFKARDLDEAREMMEADPAVAAGVFKARVSAFRLAFWE